MTTKQRIQLDRRIADVLLAQSMSEGAPARLQARIEARLMFLEEERNRLVAQ